MDNPYTIWNPGYYHMSGGIRAIHQLKQELLKRDVTVHYHNEQRYDNEIMIYPEIVSGNPQNAKNHIKWLLNKADFPDEICFAWETGMGEYPLLTVNIIEMDLWKPSANRGGDVAFWVGKGTLDPSVLPENAIQVSRSNFFNRQELAEFISTLDYMISFDPFTAINLECVVSGVPVLICSENSFWSKEKVLKQNWIPYGVAWNINELEKARSSVHLARDHYEKLLNIFDNRIDNFITETQNIFN